MQPLQHATAERASPDRCARELLAGVPVVMRFIRAQMRRHRQAELTVPQFRTLVFVSRHEDATLSVMAEHLGLSLPAASRMVGLLVKRGLLERQVRAKDRRRVGLSLTPRGQAAFRKALAAAQVALARNLRTVSRRELARISVAMRILNGVFAPENGQGKTVK